MLKHFQLIYLSKLGINISNKNIIIVKSTNHFYKSFNPHVSEIIYASIDGIYPNNPKKNKYTKLKRKFGLFWPFILLMNFNIYFIYK